MLDLKNIFNFPLDNFQQEAIEVIHQGFSLVLTAPTGAGKTLVGEFAIYRAISHKNKVFYTTPLKALSNQKFRDFREQFGKEKVGLMTGDLSINRDASVIVMTTEIFRNMLYAAVDNDNEDPLCEVETVVLDECHYMNDPQRGTVWEETIIHCPSRIQIVALSATIANADQLTKWIRYVHGETSFVLSNDRPVPLEYLFCSYKGIHPLLNDKRTGIHPNCKIWRPSKGNRKKNRSNKINQPKGPSTIFVVSNLFEKKMLPAIFFIFSRKGCDKAVENISDLVLVNSQEKLEIEKKLNNYILKNPEAIRDSIHIEALKNGVASHHAGVLPAWKEFIEDLFQESLIKVVFATETLAAGINMPARTTVISSLSKRSDDGHRLLLSNEFLQMAGRAGRRGKDTQGYVITLQSRFEGAKEAFALAISKPNSLSSQFTPSYGMVLNLLQNYDLIKSKELVQRSFGSYLDNIAIINERNELKQLEKKLSELRELTNQFKWDDLNKQEKIQERIKEEKRLLRILREQAAINLGEELNQALINVREGTLITINLPQLNRKNIPAVLVKKFISGQNITKILCLSIDNIWTLIKSSNIVNLHNEIDRINIESLLIPKLSGIGEIFYGNNQSKEVSIHISNASDLYDLQSAQYDLTQEVVSQLKLIKELEANLKSNSIYKLGDFKKIKRKKQVIKTIENEFNNKKNYLEEIENRHWITFLSLKEILSEFGCFEDLQLTDIGKSISSLRGDNELWIGLVLLSGYLDDLHPFEFAGILQAVSIEVRRPEIWSDFSHSSTLDEVIHDLNGIKNRIRIAQSKFSIEIPLNLDDRLIGIVIAWSKGINWTDLVDKTSLDEGDLVRILRRTVDMLSQVQHCVGVSNKLRRNARNALKAINRFPVCESLDLFVESEKLDGGNNPATERIN
tara:strand:+ start:9639 stop:12371 length:2733 start_codon:yes stop_codon:yes gene_type:complete